MNAAGQAEEVLVGRVLGATLYSERVSSGGAHPVHGLLFDCEDNAMDMINNYLFLSPLHKSLFLLDLDTRDTHYSIHGVTPHREKPGKPQPIR